MTLFGSLNHSSGEVKVTLSLSLLDASIFLGGEFDPGGPEGASRIGSVSCVNDGYFLAMAELISSVEGIPPVLLSLPSHSTLAPSFIFKRCPNFLPEAKRSFFLAPSIVSPVKCQP